MADSVARRIHGGTPHSYVTFLLNGRVVAANIRQDSMSYYEKTDPALQSFAATAMTTTGELKPYRPGTAPAEFGICPGVVALDYRTRAP